MVDERGEPRVQLGGDATPSRAPSGIMRGMTNPIRKRHLLAVFVLLALLAVLVAGCRPRGLPIHHATAIEWQGYEAGLPHPRGHPNGRL